MRDLLFFSPAGKEGRVARGEPLHSARARRSGRRPVSIRKLCMQETLLRSRARGTDSFVTFEAASETCLFFFEIGKSARRFQNLRLHSHMAKYRLLDILKVFSRLHLSPRRALRHYSPRADPARPGNAAARLVPASREALRERSRSRDPAPRTFATPRATWASEIPHRPGREKARSAHVASPPPFR
jgi:hypothetical protein